MREEEGLVYMLRHRITGLAYVGKTKVGGLAERISLHVNWSRKGKGAEGSLHHLIRTDGIDAFEVLILEERAPNALEAERRYIALHNTFNAGLNRSEGGERGGYRRRLKFHGVWYEGFADLAEKQLGKHSRAALFRGYRILRGRLNRVSKEEQDELLSQALDAMRAPPKPAPRVIEYRGVSYPGLKELLAEQLPDAPISVVDRVRRLLAKYEAPTYSMSRAASLEAALDALHHPERTLRRLEEFLATHSHCRVPCGSPLHRSVEHVLRTAPENLDFAQRLVALQFSVSESEHVFPLLADVRPKGRPSWHRALLRWHTAQGKRALDESVLRWEKEVLAARDVQAPSPLQLPQWRRAVVRAARKKARLSRRVKATPAQHQAMTRFMRIEVQQRYGATPASPHFFPSAELWLREACFPLPRSFGESDLVVRKLVQDLGIKAVFQLPLRAALRLLTERRREGEFNEETETQLQAISVHWCANRKRYRQLRPGFEVKRTLADEARQERLTAMAEPDWA